MDAVDVDVHNVVCTFDLGRTVNLAEIAVLLQARYDPTIFPACVQANAKSRTSSQIFGTGGVVLVGCKTIEIGLITAHQLVLDLTRRCHMPFQMLRFQPRNIVSRIDLHVRLDLPLLFRHIRTLDHLAPDDEPAYDPETFPGMAFVACDQYKRKITIALFQTGRGVATGLKHMEQIDWCQRWLALNLAPFELGQSPDP